MFRHTGVMLPSGVACTKIVKDDWVPTCLGRGAEQKRGGSRGQVDEHVFVILVDNA